LPVEFEQNRALPGESARRLEPPGDSKNFPLRLEISRRSPGGGNAAVYGDQVKIMARILGPSCTPLVRAKDEQPPIFSPCARVIGGPRP
jgi:hypothetical protein